jgi:hypothetical protein
METNIDEYKVSSITCCQNKNQSCSTNLRKALLWSEIEHSWKTFTLDSYFCCCCYSCKAWPNSLERVEWNLKFTWAFSLFASLSMWPRPPLQKLWNLLSFHTQISSFTWMVLCLESWTFYTTLMLQPWPRQISFRPIFNQLLIHSCLTNIHTIFECPNVPTNIFVIS